jgi:hypothetical protein
MRRWRRRRLQHRGVRHRHRRATAVAALAGHFADYIADARADHRSLLRGIRIAKPCEFALGLWGGVGPRLRGQRVWQVGQIGGLWQIGDGGLAGDRPVIAGQVNRQMRGV